MFVSVWRTSKSTVTVFRLKTQDPKKHENNPGSNFLLLANINSKAYIYSIIPHCLNSKFHNLKCSTWTEHKKNIEERILSEFINSLLLGSNFLKWSKTFSPWGGGFLRTLFFSLYPGNIFWFPHKHAAPPGAFLNQTVSVNVIYLLLYLFNPINLFALFSRFPP